MSRRSSIRHLGARRRGLRVETLERRQLLAATLGFTGEYSLENWTAESIDNGTTAISPSTGESDQASFDFEVTLNSGGFNREQTVDFLATAAATGSVTFDYEFTGNSRFFQADALFDTVSAGDATTVVDARTSGNFTFNGSATLVSQSGQPLGFRIGGRNSDSNRDIFGQLSVTNIVFHDSIVVDSAADGDDGDFSPGNLTLREAVRLANEIDGADTISFAEDLAGQTIVLTQGELAIRDSVTIIGLGADQLTISGDNQFRVFADLGSGSRVIAISDLTIADGFGNAGAYLSLGGDTTFRRVVMSGNDSIPGGGSTILVAFGRLTIEDSSIVNNGSNGVGAIRLQDMQTTITNTTISGNATRGISVFNSSSNQDKLSLNSVTIANNASDGIEVVANNSTTLIEYQNTLFSNTTNRRSITARANDVGLAGLSIVSLGHNLLDDTPEGLAAHDADPSDLRDTDPLLGELADNGGPTPTHALLPGSPAIDAGPIGGLFTDQQVVSDSEIGASSVSAADINGDGHVDVVSSRGNEVVWHENDGAENFTERFISAFDGAVSASIAADLDGDGNVDVISATNFQNGVTDRGVFWHENDGSGNFTRRSVSSAGAVSRVASLFVADVDGDRDQDILAITNSTSGNNVTVLENDGSQNFTVRPVGAASFGTTVFAADVDSDGNIDVLTASRNDDKIAWFENLGGLTFQEHVISTSANGGRGVFAIDVDGDRDIDVLSASNQDSKVAWYENDGNQNFTEKVISTNDRDAFAVFAADYDDDGDIDVLSSAVGDGELVLHVNDGSENFAARRFGSGLANARNLFSADVDGDGDLDALTGSSTAGTTISWFENFGLLPDANGNPLTFDQRGEGFTRIVGDQVDIGAFEIGFDFGDAPAPFATNREDDGARHMLVGPSLGSLRDADTDGVNSELADADGNDEDGVTFGVAQIGIQANVLIDVKGAPGKLDAWIDFDRNGKFTSEEQIFTSTEVVVGENQLTFAVPKTATAGDAVARFRLSTEGGLSPVGIANDGEVEDYLVSLLPQSLVQVALNYNFNGIVHADEPAATGLTIDDFQVLDAPNDFAATSIGSSSITVEVADNNGGTIANAVENRYDFLAPNVGDTFVARYDWPGVFADLPGASTGQSIQSIPLGNFDGDWQLTIDNGTGSPVLFTTLPPSALPNPIELDNATFLQFAWTFIGNSGSDGFGSFGAVSETSDLGGLSSFLALDPDDPDNPIGYRSISDRGLDFRDGVPTHPILDRYDLISSGGDLDIVHLGNRDTVDGGRRSFDSEVDGDSRGVQPDWLVEVDQSGRQTTELASPIPIREDTQVELLFQFSNRGGSFDVVVGLSDGTEFVSTVTGPDWFAPFNGQPNIGAFPGTGSVDLGLSAADLLITEVIVELGAFDGLQVTSVSFENSSNTNGGIAILAANLVSVAQDFGDAPDSFGATLAEDGARHIAIGPRLGLSRDTEADGAPSDFADADTGDDGVMFGVLGVGMSTAGVNVDLQNAESAFIDAWIDFDRDGLFQDDEQILASQLVNNVGSIQTLNYAVNQDVVAGETFARVRVSSAGGLGVGGLAADGEVEDYAVTILPRPAIESISINAGEAQRSLLTELVVTFDSEVDAPANAFQIRDRQSGTVLDTLQVSNVVIGTGQTVSTLSFGEGGNLVFDRVNGEHTLVDGNYVLTIDSSLIQLVGGGPTLESDVDFGVDDVDGFFRFFGDSDGDRDVDGQDLGRFAQSFPKTLGEEGFDRLFDSDGDEDVDGQDYGRIASNFLQSI
ncbi:MAG: FG-GAP-like repeat-containing protein [Planctomycetota bacterium]